MMYDRRLRISIVVYKPTSNVLLLEMSNLHFLMIRKYRTGSVIAKPSEKIIPETLMADNSCV